MTAPNPSHNGNQRSPLQVDLIVSANFRKIIADRHTFGSKTNLMRKLGEATGLSYQQIQKYENGRNRISAGRLWQFCKFFDCNITDFYRGVE
jgi:transcriptional regulator with XRE-family HTH domain